VPNSSDPADSTSTTECFDVAPVLPTLSTQVGNASVTLGNPITDTATLTGTANRPGTPVINPTTPGAAAGGQIGWVIYGPDSCTTVAASGISRNVSGDGTYGPVSFTPTLIGVYVFQAFYSGDSPNTSPVPAIDCGSQPNTEKVTVIGNAHVTTAQNWLPNDTAHLTGDTTLNGTVTFTLFHSANCTGTAVYGPVDVPVVNGAASGADYSTNNTQFTVSTAGSTNWSWLVHYHDNVQTSPPDDCESTVVNITN
jgi:hypothetical protein